MLISFFLMIIISTSLTVPGQPLPRFHVEAWLPFRNCEMDHSHRFVHCLVLLRSFFASFGFVSISFGVPNEFSRGKDWTDFVACRVKIY